MSPIPMPIFSMSERKITVKSGQKLKEVTHIGPVNTMRQIWALLIAYQQILLGLGERWFCVPLGSNSKAPIIASHIELLDSHLGSH